MPIISSISAPLKSQYTKAERRVIGLAAFAAFNTAVGGGLYYYVRAEVDSIEEAF